VKAYVLLPLLLGGCSYRYGTGYFMNDLPPVKAPVAYPEPEHYPMTIPSASPTSVASAEPPCEEEGVKTTTLEVTNQLDNKNNTIKTTAVTETHETRKPCKH